MTKKAKFLPIKSLWLKYAYAPIPFRDDVNEQLAPEPCTHNSTRSLNAWVSFGDGTVTDLAQFPIKGTEWDVEQFNKWVAGVKVALADE